MDSLIIFNICYYLDNDTLSEIYNSGNISNNYLFKHKKFTLDDIITFDFHTDYRLQFNSNLTHLFLAIEYDSLYHFHQLFNIVNFEELDNININNINNYYDIDNNLDNITLCLKNAIKFNSNKIFKYIFNNCNFELYQNIFMDCIIANNNNTLIDLLNIPFVSNKNYLFGYYAIYWCICTLDLQSLELLLNDPRLIVMTPEVDEVISILLHNNDINYKVKNSIMNLLLPKLESNSKYNYHLYELCYTVCDYYICLNHHNSINYIKYIFNRFDFELSQTYKDCNVILFSEAIKNENIDVIKLLLRKKYTDIIDNNNQECKSPLRLIFDLNKNNIYNIINSYSLSHDNVKYKLINSINILNFWKICKNDDLIRYKAYYINSPNNIDQLLTNRDIFNINNGRIANYIRNLY